MLESQTIPPRKPNVSAYVAAAWIPAFAHRR
jgi:hypothetical protein